MIDRVELDMFRIEIPVDYLSLQALVVIYKTIQPVLLYVVVLLLLHMWL
jgi:hypothetical protein